MLSYLNKINKGSINNKLLTPKTLGKVNRLKHAQVYRQIGLLGK
jgi:hypothetical protein